MLMKMKYITIYDVFVYSYFVDIDSSTLPRNKKNAESAKRSVSDSDMNGHKVSSGKIMNFQVCSMKYLSFLSYRLASNLHVLHFYILNFLPHG